MRISRLAVFFISGLCFSACGKFGRPVPPEALSPAAVEALSISADATSVALSWKAPRKDIRSRELRSIEGYEVLRATLGGSTPTRFDRLAFVEDIHLRERDRLQAEARAAGTPVRRVKVDPSLTAFRFTDSEIIPGSRYIYRVVPVNQGGTKGAVGESLALTFTGPTSQVTRIGGADLESELFDEALDGGDL